MTQWLSTPCLAAILSAIFIVVPKFGLTETLLPGRLATTEAYFSQQRNQKLTPDMDAQEPICPTLILFHLSIAEVAPLRLGN
ncbi:MAG: hypothetical protein M0Q95_15475 [Porticoccaceae bacterium]|nr:hypothetical protein [Porticoccaceae bacterium]